MTEAKVPPKTVHLSIRVSEDLWLLMQQLIQKGGHANINEFVRTCIRAYVDETGDVIGSRRHFNNRLAERMDRLEALILWNSLHGQVLSASGLFTVLDELAPDDAPQEPPTPDVQLGRATEYSKRLLPQFIAGQTDIVEQLRQYRTDQARKPKTK